MQMLSGGGINGCLVRQNGRFGWLSRPDRVGLETEENCFVEAKIVELSGCSRPRDDRLFNQAVVQLLRVSWRQIAGGAAGYPPGRTPGGSPSKSHWQRYQIHKISESSQRQPTM